MRLLVHTFSLSRISVTLNQGQTRTEQFQNVEFSSIYRTNLNQPGSYADVRFSLLVVSKTTVFSLNPQHTRRLEIDLSLVTGCL